MSLVMLASGGLDSTLSALLARENKIQIYPLFVDYGQIAKQQELKACQVNYKYFGLPDPEIADIHGFGQLYPSGLTNVEKDVFKDAFLPGRNMLFLLVAATYACNVNANAISIGFLHEKLSLFPDQTKEFLDKAQDIICMMTGRELKILAPLMEFTKKDVVELAKTKGILGTYSCHAGGDEPCGYCIACKEFDF